jgi:saccharopine dehydrogenase-like NADP-dependent oxidoreductase
MSFFYSSPELGGNLFLKIYFIVRSIAKFGSFLLWMIARSKKRRKKTKTRRKLRNSNKSLSEASSGAMAAGNGTPAAIVAAAMMEEGLGMGTVNGHDKGNFWSLDQNMDKPLGLEANRVQSMQYRKVREHS